MKNGLFKKTTNFVFIPTGDGRTWKSSSVLLGLLKEVNEELRGHAEAAGLGQSPKLEKCKFYPFSFSQNSQNWVELEDFCSILEGAVDYD